MFQGYPAEVVDTEGDGQVMSDNVQELRDGVVGHRIIEAGWKNRPYHGPWEERVFHIKLDNGKRVILRDTDDCCAYTELQAFLVNVDKIDHIITGVGTTEGYTKWHIFADLGDVLEITVGWSEGSGYYGYGFSIAVEDIVD